MTNIIPFRKRKSHYARRRIALQSKGQRAEAVRFVNQL